MLHFWDWYLLKKKKQHTHTRLEKIEIPEPKDEVNLAQDGFICFR